MARVRVVALGALTLAYPLLVYLAMGRFEPRWMALLLFALATLRALSARQPMWWVAAAAAGVLALLSTVFNQLLPLKLYPALVNVVMLALFGASLRFGPPLVERLARLQDPVLPPYAVAYTRRVTQVWCGFFVLNGALALVIGGEGDGLSKLVAEKCDFLVAIPQYGQIGSLNAGVAAGVLMFEKKRQDKAE